MNAITSSVSYDDGFDTEPVRISKRNVIYHISRHSLHPYHARDHRGDAIADIPCKPLLSSRMAAGEALMLVLWTRPSCRVRCESFRLLLESMVISTFCFLTAHSQKHINKTRSLKYMHRPFNQLHSCSHKAMVPCGPPMFDIHCM